MEDPNPQVAGKGFALLRAANVTGESGLMALQLEVMFAEVSRTASRELGLNVLYGDRSLAPGIGPTTGRPSRAQRSHPSPARGLRTPASAP